MKEYVNLATDDEMVEREQQWEIIPWDLWGGEVDEYSWSYVDAKYGKYGEIVLPLNDEITGFLIGKPNGEILLELLTMGIDADKYFWMIREALESGERGLISNVVSARQDHVGVWSPTGYGYDYEGWELVVRFDSFFIF